MIADLQQKVQHFVTENASALLTAGGIVGTVGTAVLTSRASFRASAILQDANREKKEAVAQEEQAAVIDVPKDMLSKTEKVALVWPLFLPPVGLGGVTITSIVMANRISAARAAALAAAYGISERRFEEYKAKTLEKLGIGKEQKLRDEIAQDAVNKNPPGKDNSVIIIGGDDILCYDMITGRYFRSSAEKVRKAQNYINTQLINYQYASLAEFFEEVGLEPTSYTTEVGWNLNRDGNLEVKLTSVLSPDEKPCLAVDFNNAPHPSYDRLY